MYKYNKTWQKLANIADKSTWWPYAISAHIILAQYF